LATVIAFVRLGRKYDIPHLSLEGFRWLQKEFPSILPQSNIRLDNFSYLGIDDDDFTKSLLNLIKLAREFNFISLLPMLFYITSNIKLEELVRGFREVDIMRSDEITIILGRDALMNTVTKNTFAWLMADYSCRGECNANRQDFFVEHWHPHQHFGAQALIAWDTNWEDDYCADCILASKRLHTQGRQRIWARLPSVFELGSWEDLMSAHSFRRELTITNTRDSVIYIEVVRALYFYTFCLSVVPLYNDGLTCL
jgi:hypothetical protein